MSGMNGCQGVLVVVCCRRERRARGNWIKENEGRKREQARV